MLLLLTISSLSMAADETVEEAPVDEGRVEEAPVGEAPQDPGWVELTVPVDFGSALEGVEAKSEAPDASGDQLAGQLLAEAALAEAEADGASTALLRGRWGLRPYLGVMGLDAAWGGTAGATLGHQWWSLREHSLRPAGQTELQATAPFGMVKGWAVHLESTHGLWLGPLGVLLGAAVHGDAMHSEDQSAVASLSAGPQGRLAARLGPVTPWVAATPTWQLVGARPSLPDQPWQELTTAAGLSIDGHPLGIRLSGQHRRLGTQLAAPSSGTHMATQGATAWQVALGLHLRLL